LEIIVEAHHFSIPLSLLSVSWEINGSAHENFSVVCRESLFFSLSRLLHKFLAIIIYIACISRPKK
jgi:hypothetical protein